MLKDKKIRFDEKDIKVLKSYVPKKRYFIPFVGHILLWKEYNRIKSQISSTTRKIINGRKLFRLSIFTDILVTNILCWVLILTDIILGAFSGVLFDDWFLGIPSPAAISLWSLNTIGHLIYIYFLFIPFVVEWKILEGVTTIDIILNKKMDSVIKFDI